eukprot:1472295-Pyramimonas_sp.AAC.1
MRWTLRGARYAVHCMWCLDADPGWLPVVGRDMRGRRVGLSPWAREVAPSDGAARGGNIAKLR